MKYIRTKDGVYDETKYKVAKAFVSAFEEEQAKIMPTQKTNFNIIKQADTIEELCDEFVIFYNKSKHKVSVLKSMATARLYHKRDKRYNGNYVDKVYGAIWTNKGLIYVAKMNESGVLELL